MDIWSEHRESLKGDFLFAGHHHDASDHLKDIDAKEAALYIVAGELDYSVKPEHTEYFKSEIQNLTDDRVIRLEGAGHYPPAENPAAFKGVMMPILERITE